jgi:hypothetical protein
LGCRSVVRFDPMAASLVGVGGDDEPAASSSVRQTPASPPRPPTTVPKPLDNPQHTTMLLSRLAPALLAIVLPLLAQADELRQLTSDTFESSIAHGQWSARVVPSSPASSVGHAAADTPRRLVQLGSSGWSSTTVPTVRPKLQGLWSGDEADPSCFRRQAVTAGPSYVGASCCARDLLCSN